MKEFKEKIKELANIEDDFMLTPITLNNLKIKQNAIDQVKFNIKQFLDDNVESIKFTKLFYPMAIITENEKDLFLILSLPNSDYYFKIPASEWDYVKEPTIH